MSSGVRGRDRRVVDDARAGRRCVGVHRRLDERPEVVGELVLLEPCLPGARVAVDDRELDLVLVGVEVEEELVDLVRRPLRCARRAGRPCSRRARPASRASSALRRTKRVCGSGPSLASTSSRTPSTIVRPRSTSPPKSAWPGVSMMLNFVSPTVDRRVLGEDRDALLALEVGRVHDALVHVLVLAEASRPARAARRRASSSRGRRARRSRRCADRLCGR